MGVVVARQGVHSGCLGGLNQSLQGVAGQGKAWRGKARRGKARRGKARQGEGFTQAA
ncbi:MAG: hypothetical protein WJ289_05420 [Ferrovum myxofaciens]|uniref:hypothetical protein n=1 Tax=Ferrovum myxofaciens TaxID=416213 RepID=UPI003EBF1C4F